MLDTVSGLIEKARASEDDFDSKYLRYIAEVQDQSIYNEVTTRSLTLHEISVILSDIQKELKQCSQA